MSAVSTPKRRHEDSETDEVQVEKRRRRSPSTNDDDRPVLPYGIKPAPEYQPGAIKKIYLKNFVTYSEVEVFPGPSLNMVIGPNGTGKSTLVCAICIGLGYETKYLGRAKNLADYVKNGHEKATIEIEVQAGPNRPTNPIFKCVISREGNKAQYNVAGQLMGAKTVKNRASKLGVQIDNLCQFLPQDRVVEFAAMSSRELLTQTLRAVAPQRMIDWHDKLKTTRNDQKKIEGEKQDFVESLTTMEAKHRMQEADVARIRERDQVKEKVQDLETALPFSRYRELKAKASEKKGDFDRLCAELDELREAVEPFMRDIKSKDTYRKSIVQAVTGNKAIVASTMEAMDAKEKKVEEVDGKIKRKEDNRTRETASVKQARNEQTRQLNIIRNLTAERAKPPPCSDEDIKSKSDNIRRCEREKRELEDVHSNDKQRASHLEGENKRREWDINAKEKEIEGLQTKSGQQLSKLHEKSPEAAKAYRWLRENQSRFEKPVFGPPLVECTVKDPRYADIVENAMGDSEWTRFTAQSNSDLRELRNCFRENGWNRVNLRAITAPLDQYRSAVNQSILQTYGLDGWILDLVEGPDVVRATLCEGSKLQSTGYALNDLSERQFSALKDSNMQRVVTSKTSYTFQRRREYGPDATNVVAADLKRARYWTDAPVDTSAISSLRANINELRDEIQQTKTEINSLRQDNADRYRTRHEQLTNEIKSLQKEKADIQAALSRYNAIDTRKQQAESALSDADRKVNEWRANDQALLRECDELALQKVQLAIEYADAVGEFRLACDTLQDIEIMHIEACSDLAHLTAQQTETQELIDAKETERDETHRAWDEAKNNARAAGERCKALIERQGHEANAFTRKIRDIEAQYNTSVALETQIESEKARLELLQGAGGGNTLAEYERRGRHIADLRQKVEDMDAAIQELAGIIKDVRSKWEPELDKLVRHISHSFSYNMKFLNCAGEVQVGKNEDDFEQWEIKIMVKFRESESLSQLDSHRQSGGERAVSTVFYLMSLQSLTQSPFRIVDEINQGMDPRNERLVHARMVAIATGTDEMPAPRFRIPKRRRDDDDEGDEDDEDDDEDEEEEEAVDGADGEEASNEELRKGSQYFLITPKLLPELKYQRGMRVLCIASGEKMDKQNGEPTSFATQLATKRRMLAAAA